MKPLALFLLGSVCAALVHAQAPTVVPPSLDMFAQLGGQLVSRSLNIGGAGADNGFSIRSTATWLSANPPSGIAPRVAMVAADPAGLPPGKYAATLSVTGSSGAVSTVPVAFTVTNDPIPRTDVTSLSFPLQMGHALPAAQDVTIASSTGAALQYAATATTATCGNSWLMLSGAVAGATDGVLTVSANPSAMTVGTCSGTVTIAEPGAGSAVAIPVSLYVADSPLLLVLPATPVAFTTPAGIRLRSGQTVTLIGTTSNAPLSYLVQCATANGGDGWLSYGYLSAPGAGNHYAAIAVDSGSLAAGTYTGACAVYGYTQDGAMTANSPVTLPVTLSVTAGTLTLDPPSLVFTAESGGIAPANLTVTSGDPSVSYSASATAAGPVNWLSVSPASGSTPGSIRVAAQASGLAAGSYPGAVRVVAHGPAWAPVAGSPAVANVTLAVPPAITAIPAAPSFLQQQGGIPPQAQTVNLSSTPASAGYTVTAATGDGASWLSARATVAVRLTVAAAPLPIVFGISNAASFAEDAISPGENVIVYGAGLGPPSLVRAQSIANGLPTTLGDTQVLFGDTLAPIYSASGSSLGVMVPYEVAGRAAVTVRVSYQGVLADPVTYAVVSAVPGIYTANNSGSGQGAIVNQDGVTLNGPSSPAPAGSVVSMYLTGEGQTAPASASGGIAPVDGVNLHRPALPVTATVAGLPADVVYCGSAPGMVYGIAQVNIRIPAAAPSGAQPIAIQIGGSRTQAGVTVAVR